MRSQLPQKQEVAMTLPPLAALCGGESIVCESESLVPRTLTPENSETYQVGPTILCIP